MTPDSLPPDLRELERELAARTRPAPPAQLRARVLAMIERERPTPRPTWDRGRFVRFAAATAAAALLAINLSASVANDTNWRLTVSSDAADVETITAQVRALDPDLSDREAVRQAILLHAAGGLTPVPASPADRMVSHKELARWDTH